MQNELAEQSVIGSLLLEGYLIKKLTIEPKHFFDERHRIVFTAMRKLEEQEKEINMVSVVQEIYEDVSKIGISYLNSLSESVPSTDPIKEYESIVYEQYRVREGKRLASDFLNNPSEESLHKLLKSIDEIKDEGVQVEEKTTKDHLLAIADEIVNPQTSKSKGFKTGFADYDHMTGGATPGDLIIIAARPSMGKTAFALNIGAGHCVNNGTSHIYSLEMGAVPLLKRMLSAEGNINMQLWKTMMFSNDDYDRAMNAIGVISNWELNIYEDMNSINQIKTSIRKNVQENPDENHLVIIDYLQLITTTSRYERRDLEVGAITRDLKLLAKELNIPIVLLSQLSRGVESRQDKRPMMSDLRESGNIEQD